MANVITNRDTKTLGGGRNSFAPAIPLAKANVKTLASANNIIHFNNSHSWCA